ncbi:MAG: DNA polymerase [Patescibacteria group bacterium]|nr:DNA polymerase [Patescibacteria group bacterium]
MSKESKNKRLVLLDAHAILHRAYHGMPDFASSKGEPTGALYGLSTMLIKILVELKPNYISACYDLPQPTYRHEAYKDYKAGRRKADPELVSQIKRSREVFDAFSIPIYDKSGFEADDILGTIVEKILKHEIGNMKHIDVVIASGDMDTLQLVDDERVQVYTLKKGISDTILYNEKKVIERFSFLPKLLPDYKGLRGDPSDNIIGIKGIGEKTATELIKNFGTIEEIYIALKKNKKKFEDIGIKPRIIELLEKNEEEAIFSKMLGTIRRDAPIDFSLPKEEWKTTLDLAKIEKLFGELEFRTLGARVKEAFFNSVSSGKVSSGETVFSGPKPSMPKNTVSPLLKEVTLALWVLDPNITNPTHEDVLRIGESQDFEIAKNNILIEISKHNLDKVYKEIEIPLIPVIDSMEKWGVKIDVDYLNNLSKEYHTELARLEKEIWKTAGKEFNINSPKQLGEILFDTLELKIKNAKKTAGGARSTKESELLKLKGEHPIIEDILNHRELQKLLSTYIDTLPMLVDEKNRLHTTFLQTGTTTGRMSSNNPNLQNIPIKSELGKKIRNAFVAEKGYSLVSFDYSQIQLRVAAFLSKDEKLIEIFKNGRDIHTEVASQVFKVMPENVDAEMRRKAKVINFGIIYGMGVNALRQNLGTDRVEAQMFYNEYFANFSGLAHYLEQVKIDTYEKGYTETYFGRRRYFEGIKSKIPFIRASAERMAINAPIQGTEADIIKLAMIDIYNFVKKDKLENDVRLLLQVHDELVCEIKSDIVKEVSEKIKKIMESVINPKDIFGVVCVADYSIGKSWGAMK